MNVILFSTGCPKCNILMKKLDMAGMDYIINDDMQEIIDKGFDSVPVVKIEDIYMDFKEANDWINDILTSN